MTPFADLDANRISRLPTVLAEVEHEQDSLTIHLTDRHLPSDLVSLIFDEVRGILQPAFEAVADAQLRVCAGKRTHASPVTAIEQLYVTIEQVEQVRVAVTLNDTIGCRGQGRKLGPAAIQCGLHAAHGGIDKVSDFLQRMIENVLQQHTGAFLRRQVDHQPLDSPIGSPAGRLHGQDEIVFHEVRFRTLARCAFPDEVDATIMRNAKQPPTQRTRIIQQVELAIGLEQRLLHDILAIHDRAGHARAITMKRYAPLCYGLQERGVAGIKEPGRINSGLHFHGAADPGGEASRQCRPACVILARKGCADARLRPYYIRRVSAGGRSLSCRPSMYIMGAAASSCGSMSSSVAIGMA